MSRRRSPGAARAATLAVTAAASGQDAALPANVVIDLSHHNGNVDLVQAKAAGILAVIQKATQGTSFVDPTLVTNRKKAGNAGLLFGAYHFGTAADGVAQAEHFLDILQPTASDLLVLDFENDLQGPSMSLEEARAFVTHINEARGRFPGLYSGHYVKGLLGTQQDPILGACWLWLAQYGPTAVVPPAWKTWTFWQYTDGAIGPGPHSVPGVGLCDRDKFNGTADDLVKFWG